MTLYSSWMVVRINWRTLSLLSLFRISIRKRLAKSCLFGLNLSQQNYLEISEATNCPTRSFPIEFLWVPLEGLPSKRDFWNLVIETVQRKLATWKSNYLSFEGRITLIKSAISNIPIYFLSSFTIPKGIAIKNETLQKQFLCCGNSDFKPYLISWEIVSRPKEKGGLGIDCTLQRNQALMGKWL